MKTSDWQINQHPTTGKFVLSCWGHCRGTFPTVNAAVIERQRVTGVRQIDIIHSERAAS